MNTCAVCRNRFEAESPAVLFISSYGSRRVLCPECEALLDAATATEPSEEKESAVRTLTERAAMMKDPEAIEMLGSLLSGELAEDAPSPEEEEEIEAVFEEIKKEEPEEETRTSAWEYVLPAVIAVAAVAFVVWFYFFR